MMDPRAVLHKVLTAAMVGGLTLTSAMSDAGRALSAGMAVSHRSLLIARHSPSFASQALALTSPSSTALGHTASVAVDRQLSPAVRRLSPFPVESRHPLRTYIPDLIGIALFAAFDYGWTRYSFDWSSGGSWHLLAVQAVTAGVGGIIANVLIQKARIRTRGGPFDRGLFVRAVAGAATYFALTEGFLLYGLLMPHLPHGPVPLFVIQSLVELLFLSPFLLNMINSYWISRMWDRENHRSAMARMRRELPEFSFKVLIVECFFVGAAFFIGEAPFVYGVISAWGIVYLRLISDRSSPRTPEPRPSAPVRMFEKIYRPAWWDIYVPLSLIAFFTGAALSLAGVPPKLTAWTFLFPSLAAASWLWTRFTRFRLNAAGKRLQRRVDEWRISQAEGESPMSLVVRLRIPLEIDYRALAFWLNRLPTHDRLGVYEEAIRRILGPGAEKIPASMLLNTEFPRTAGDLLDFCRTGRASERLVSLAAVDLDSAEPRALIDTWPELFEERTTGIEQPSRWWRGPGQRWPEPALPALEIPATRQDETLTLQNSAGQSTDLKVLKITSLDDNDRRELTRWTKPWPQYEVDDDLDHVLLTGLRPGESIYKLVRQAEATDVTEAFALLFYTEGHLHLHIVFANPTRPDQEAPKGIGRALCTLAFRDAVALRVPLTTFPTTPEAVRLFESLGFKSLAVDGTHMSEMWIIQPEAMQKNLEGRGGAARFPRVGSFIRVPVYRRQDSIRMELHGVVSQTTGRVLISRRLFEHFADDPEALRLLVRSWAENYLRQQEAAPDRVFILDDIPGTFSGAVILTAEEYEKRLGAGFMASPKPFVTSPSNPPKPVRYRRASADDLDALVLFRDKYYAKRTYHRLPATSETLLRVILAGQWPGDIFLAEDDSGIVGYALAYTHPALGYGEIEEGMVVPNLQPYNVGDQLLNRCAEATLERLPAGLGPKRQPMVLVQEQSELTLVAKTARRNAFVPYPGVPNLWGRPPHAARAGAKGFWFWLRPGFEARDPRRFPSGLVPQLLRAADRYHDAEIQKAGKTYVYIFRYRPWDWRVWRAWGWRYGRYWTGRLRAFAVVMLLALVAIFSLWAPETSQPPAAVRVKRSLKQRALLATA